MRLLARHPVPLFLLVAGFVGSVAVAWERHRVESGYRTVELVLDSEAWKVLFQREAQAGVEPWQALRAHGAGSVAVYEATLRRLQDEGRVSYRSGSELRDLLRTGTLAPPLRALAARADAAALYVVPADPEVARQVQWGFRTALGPERVAVVLREPLVLRVLGRPRDLEETGLGFLPSSVRRWESLGFRVVLRPRNVRSFTPERLAQRVAGYAHLVRGHTVVFELSEVLGYERLVEVAASALRDAGALYGRVEVLTPVRRMRGEEAMTRLMRPQVLRVISIPPEELERIPREDAVDRFARGVRERNARMVYLRPYLQTPGGVDPVRFNLKYVEQVASAVREAGFQLGPARSLPEVTVPSGLRWGARAAAVASVVLLLVVAAQLSGRPVSQNLALSAWTAGMAVLAAGSAAGLALWVNKLAALGAAVAFPTLALWAVADWAEGRRWGLVSALLALWATSAVSAAGGVVVAALLVDWPFRMAADTFLGVKVATVAPPVLLGALYFAGQQTEPSRNAVWEQLRRWLARPVTVGGAVAVAVVAGVAVLLLLRTGNTGVPVPSVEERLRDALERALVARPRTKEYLLGHPALVLAVTAKTMGFHGWTLPLLVAGAVGQAGLVNSFSHLHTPLLYTAWRTANGLLLGTVLGSVLYLCARRLGRPLAAAAHPPSSASEARLGSPESSTPVRAP